jgi:hypothetical protein
LPIRLERQINTAAVEQEDSRIRNALYPPSETFRVLDGDEFVASEHALLLEAPRSTKMADREKGRDGGTINFVHCKLVGDGEDAGHHLVKCGFAETLVRSQHPEKAVYPAGIFYVWVRSAVKAE